MTLLAEKMKAFPLIGGNPLATTPTPQIIRGAD
jgi:hypothetical protein